MILNWPVVILMTISATVGVLVGYAIASRKDLNKKILKVLDRKTRRRRDTENNIGNRFWKIVQEVCAGGGRFWFEHNLSKGQGYGIIVRPRGGGQRLLQLGVNLGWVDEAQIHYSFGDDGNRIHHLIDEASIRIALQQVEEYLKTL